MSKRKKDVSQFAWTPAGAGSATALAEVQTVTLDQRAALLAGTGDNAILPTIKVLQRQDPTLTVVLEDIETMLLMSPGQKGAAAWKQNDAINREGAGVINWALARATLANYTNTAQHQNWASNNLPIECDSADGVTSPLTYTVGTSIPFLLPELRDRLRSYVPPAARVASARPRSLPNRPPDAVQVPDGYSGLGNAIGRAYWVQQFVSPIFGLDPEGDPMEIHGLDLLNNNLVTPEPGATLKFDADHPFYPKMDRYDWTDRGDGIRYGYLNALVHAEREALGLPALPYAPVSDVPTFGGSFAPRGRHAWSEAFSARVASPFLESRFARS